MLIDLGMVFKMIWPIVLGVVLLVVLLTIFVAVATSLTQEPLHEYRYLRKDSIMTEFEREFFKVLFGAIDNQYYVFPQVHLDAIISYKIGGKSRFGAFRHINEKSVDFVICDKEQLRPLLAIELDDSSHNREDRRKRDEEVERILNEAGMPLLRINHNGRYDVEEIKQLVFEKLR